MDFIHHILDIWPEPREAAPRFINESWLIDSTVDIVPDKRTPPEAEEDNIRIYVPLDLNKKAILRRLDEIIEQYGDATEENEMEYSIAVERLFMQVEVYDQYWYVRHLPSDREAQRHSEKCVSLVKEIIGRLENIVDIDSEYFPFDVIRDLKKEYLGMEAD